MATPLFYHHQGDFFFCFKFNNEAKIGREMGFNGAMRVASIAGFLKSSYCFSNIHFYSMLLQKGGLGFKN